MTSLGPGMSAEALRYRFHFRLALEVDRDPASLPEGVAVQLQPARLATARKPAIGHDDVGFTASPDDRAPIDAGRRTGRQQSVFAAAVLDPRDAGVFRATAERRLGKQLRIVIEARRLAHQVLNEVATPV